MWWFGIKKDIEKLRKEVKQLKCKHHCAKSIFTEEYIFVPLLGISGINRELKCSECGAVLEVFDSEIDMQIAKGKWHKKESERLDIDKLLWTEYLHKKMGEKALFDSISGEAKNTEANVAGEQKNFVLYKANYPGVILRAQEKRKKDIIVCDGDYIKKIKGRWVHVKSGKVLKVRK